MNTPQDNSERSRLRDSAPWLGMGLSVSLLLHLSVGVLLVRSAQPSLDIRTPTQDMGREDPVGPQLRLGLEESTIASINWLGFEEPTEHAAPVLFDLDQAALAREASNPAPPDPAIAQNRPTSPTADPVDPGQAEASASATGEETTAAAAPAGAVENVESAPATAAESPVVISVPEEGPWVDPAAEPQPIEGPPTPETTKQTEALTSPRPQPETQPNTQPASPSAAPQGPAVPTATPPSPLATPDDRDSTPAAKEISLTLDRIGKPAAGEGIEINTVRLDSQDKAVRFLAGSVRDPVVMMEFRREKKGPATVSTVSFEQVEQPNGTVIVRNTGNADIDRILRLNIYRWTATGKAIDELEIGKTVQIRLSIDLR